MSRNHPYRNLKVPKNAPFKLKPSAGKGWGAFATREIKQEALILTEEPLFFIWKHHDYITEADISLAVQQLPLDSKMQFFSLLNNGNSIVTRFQDVMAENSFCRLRTNRDILKSPSSPGWGLFVLCSRFNHSCIPNATAPHDTADGLVSLFATRDIAVGEEITFCYETDFHGRTRSERHERLQFVCSCKVCLPDDPKQQVISDMRRNLIRGLEFLARGQDLADERGTLSVMQSQIISNPTMRRDAENFSVPLSKRLVHWTLVMCLLEAEGLLDPFLIRKLQSNFDVLVSMFQVANNMKHANLALEQETWLSRFCMASKFYGVSDSGDKEFTQVLRLLRSNGWGRKGLSL